MTDLADEENIIKFKELVQQLKALGYDCALPEQKAEIAKTLDYLYEHPASRDQLASLLNFMEQPASGAPSAATSFDLPHHLSALSMMLETPGATELFEKIRDSRETVDFRLNVKELWSTMKPLEAEKSAVYLQTAESILEKLKTSDGKVNESLKGLSEKVPITFCITKGNEKDGECRIVNGEDGRHCVISVSEGAFADKRLLPMLIAHELGHYVDSVQRPPEFKGMLPQGQEYIADILGAEMACNAGFKTSGMSLELGAKNNEFLTKRAKNLADYQELYYKSDLQRRLEQVPNTPAGRKIRNFVNETDRFFDAWSAEKVKADNYYMTLSDEQKQDILLQAMDKFPEMQGMSREEKMRKFEEKVQQNLEAERKISGQEIAEEYVRTCLSENTIKSHLYNQLAVLKINARFNPYFDPELNKGYCTASIMQCLKESDKQGELETIFNTDTEQLAHPETLFKHLMTAESGRYAKHIYNSGEDGCTKIQDVIEKHKLMPGALVCVTMDAGMEKQPSLDGSHNHLMLYVGKDRSGEDCFYGFNNDIKDGKLKNKNVGYVCDCYSMFADMIRDHHQIYMRNHCTSVGEIETKNISAKEQDVTVKDNDSRRDDSRRGGSVASMLSCCRQRQNG